MIDDPLIGRQLANFRIKRAIGQGGMAQVYYAQDVKLKRPVAIKVIDARHRDKPAYAQRFVREAQTIAKWRHEHIIQIYYADDRAGLYYFVMEYIEGQDLGQMIAKYPAKGPLMPPAEVLRIGRAVAEALDYAHQRGVIHRDVKPSNVLIANDGRVVLADFGLALDVEQGSVGEVFGSANYIAPEQARHSADAKPQSDLYSLGVILYEMLTGRVPFNDPSATTVALQHLTQPPPSPRQLNPKLTRATEAVLLKALSKSPHQRYQTGLELMEALEQSFLPQPAAAGRRWGYIGLILAGLVVIVAALFWQGNGGNLAWFTGAASATPPATSATSTSEAAAFAPPSATLTVEAAPLATATVTPLPTLAPPTVTSSPSTTATPPPLPTLTATALPKAAFTPLPFTPTLMAAATATPFYLADTKENFTGNQGYLNWHYQWSEGRDSFVWQDMQFDGNSVCWRAPNQETQETTVRLCRESAHPGLTGDIAWRWVSTVTGPIQVSLSAYKLDTQGGDGVVIVVYRNTEEIKRWPLAANDSTGINQQFSLDINQGDYLFFVIKVGNDSTNDETAFRAQVYQ